MKTKQKHPEQIRKPWAQEVAPIIKATAHVRGFATVVARHMSKLTGSEVKRQQVAGWLSADPDKRPTPSNDTAIVILEAVRLSREELGL